MLINNETDFKKITDCVDKLFNRDQSLPSQVFKEQFYTFSFEESEWIASSDFWINTLQVLGNASMDKNIFIMITDKNTRDYFLKQYNILSAFKIPIDSTDNQYLNALHTAPLGFNHENLFLLSRTIVIVSESGKWAIYGDRLREVAILGFSKNFTCKIKKTESTNWRLAGKALSELICFTFKDLVVPEPWANEFLKNYGESTTTTLDCE